MKNILSENNQKENGLEAKEQECIEIEETIVRFRVEVNFTNMKDEAKLTSTHKVLHNHLLLIDLYPKSLLQHSRDKAFFALRYF